jgi:hypothetical protein
MGGRVYNGDHRKGTAGRTIEPISPEVRIREQTLNAGPLQRGSLVTGRHRCRLGRGLKVLQLGRHVSAAAGAAAVSGRERKSAGIEVRVGQRRRQPGANVTIL